ncbi:hypothetical protein N665_0425s0001 [Sinapis alba]|nr:hypothetical protein N665_0425s0001 [Sinapis alba]
MKQRTCLKNKSDPGKFAVPCLIKGNEYPSALYDTGSLVSIMPKTMAEELNLKVETSNDSFTFVDCSKVNSGGIIKNVPVQINNTLVPVDFHVMDIHIDWNSSLILGRAFMATVGAICDMKQNMLYLFLIDQNNFYEPVKNKSKATLIESSNDVELQSVDTHPSLSIDSLTPEPINTCHAYGSYTPAYLEYDEDYREEELIEYRGIAMEEAGIFQVSHQLGKLTSIDGNHSPSIDTDATMTEPVAEMELNGSDTEEELDELNKMNTQGVMGLDDGDENWPTLSRESNASYPAQTSQDKDPLCLYKGPITRSQTRRLKKSIAALARKEARSKRKGNKVATGETDGRDTSSGTNTDVSKSARAALQTRTHTNRAPMDTPDDSLDNLKLRIPSFSGTNDPDVFLEWEKKIELVFDCQNYSESKKVRLAATEFNGYALHWWDQIVTTRRRTREPQVFSWFELKTIMRRRFVPGHYSREVHHKLRRLTQGSKSVEDYYQEMEILMLKAAVDEDSEETMARFLAGLNRYVQDRLELQEYVDIYELLHKAILIEKQMKRKLNPRASYGNTRPAYGKEDKVFVKPKEEAKVPGRNDQGKAPTTRTRDVKCFKCHGIGHYANECTNKKVMILLESGELISEASGEEVVDYPVHGLLLITRRSLKVQSTPEEHDQRENLFHTRCLVYDKVCSLIIDGGSCTNVASESLVAKLGLQTGKHPKPYMLQWLNEDGELKVT